MKDNGKFIYPKRQYFNPMKKMKNVINNPNATEEEKKSCDQKMKNAITSYKTNKYLQKLILNEEDKNFTQNSVGESVIQKVKKIIEYYEHTYLPNRTLKTNVNKLVNNIKEKTNNKINVQTSPEKPKTQSNFVVRIKKTNITDKRMLQKH